MTIRSRWRAGQVVAEGRRTVTIKVRGSFKLMVIHPERGRKRGRV